MLSSIWMHPCCVADFIFRQCRASVGGVQLSGWNGWNKRPACTSVQMFLFFFIDYFNSFSNWHRGHLWLVHKQSSFHIHLPVAHRQEKRGLPFLPPLDTGDQMVCLQRSLVASCYILQCGLIWQLSEQFCCLDDRATGKIAHGLISSLIQCTANISDKDIWRREVHSSGLSSLEPEPCSLDRFRQHAHFDKQRMQCLYAGRQAGRQTHKQHTPCALVQTQMINLCRTTNILPSHFAPNSFPVCHNVYTCNNTHCFMLVTYFITLFVSRPQHCMPDVCCNVSGRKQLHLGHPVYGRTNQWEIVFHLQSIWDGQNQPDVPGFC